MKKYELFLVLPGTLDENETAQKTGEVMAIVNELGQNAELKPMGKNRLAYPIKQVRYGYFFTVLFDAEPGSLKQIEEKLRLTRGLLRSTVYLFNKASEGAEKIAYFSQTSTLAEPEAVKQEIAAAAPEEKTGAAEVTVASEAVEAKGTLETDKEPEEKKVRPAQPKAPKIDLKEIDKKLDEILSDEDINI